MESPLVRFKVWWKLAYVDSPLKQKNAICLSTLNTDGFPSGRFVDLKAVDEEGFTICTYLDSRKGHDIALSPKVGMTTWWDHVGYQIRITGFAKQIPETEAVKHWATRTRDAQLTTLSCKQSQVLESEEWLKHQLALVKKQYQGREIPKPEAWGGYKIKPVSIEFLAFTDTRLHKRELFEVDADGAWQMKLLQP